MCASWDVSSLDVSTVRLRTVSPVARSSRRARSANAVDAHRRQRLVGGPQLRPGVDPSTFPPQPFAVEQLRAGELDAHPGAAEPLDRLTVQRLRCGVVA